jgi:transcriptional regulator with XRE-family HTH domain
MANRLDPFKSLGPAVSRKRGNMGIRSAAAEIEISPATLSRIENGRIPDLDTLKKVCRWLGEDPGLYLGTADKEPASARPVVQIAFRKDKTVTQKTSKALATLILAAYQQFAENDDADGHQ